MNVCVVGAAVALVAIGAAPVFPCTAFTAACGSRTLVGNNEDYNDPKTRIWFVPSSGQGYGRMYMGYENGFPQGGMNEAGLFFDGFAVERQAAARQKARPRLEGSLVDKAMAECRTVEEVVRLYERYDRSDLESGVLMFVDARGDAVAIEADAMVRKKGPSFVQTNFRQSSTPRTAVSCPRFHAATRGLERMGKCATVEAFRDVLAATSVGGEYPTLYSNVYDLERRVMHLYYFRDFAHAKTIDLREELKRGAHTIEMASLFPGNDAARAFAEGRERLRATERSQLTRVALDDDVLAGYVGRYRFENGLSIIVRKDGTRLMAETNEPFISEVLPESPTTFFFADAACQGSPACRSVRLTFVVGPSGQAERLEVLAGTGDRLRGHRTPDQ